MLTTSGLFEDDDWEFTSEKSAIASPGNQKQRKAWEATHPTLKQQDRFKAGGVVTVYSASKCFTGMVIALPLSLLAWTGIFAFLYFLIQLFK